MPVADSGCLEIPASGRWRYALAVETRPTGGGILVRMKDHRSKDNGRDETSSELCPICWGQHAVTSRHDVVATVSQQGRRGSDRGTVQARGPWPKAYDREDPGERAYGLLRLLDDAAGGLDHGQIGTVWVIARSKGGPSRHSNTGEISAVRQRQPLATRMIGWETRG